MTLVEIRVDQRKQANPKYEEPEPTEGVAAPHRWTWSRFLRHMGWADVRVVEEAVAAVQSLTPLSRCADAEALKAQRPQPKGQAQKEPVEKARGSNRKYNEL